jgi:hypothetical protein
MYHSLPTLLNKLVKQSNKIKLATLCLFAFSIFTAIGDAPTLLLVSSSMTVALAGLFALTKAIHLIMLRQHESYIEDLEALNNTPLY